MYCAVFGVGVLLSVTWTVKVYVPAVTLARLGIEITGDAPELSIAVSVAAVPSKSVPIMML